VATDHDGVGCMEGVYPSVEGVSPSPLWVGLYAVPEITGGTLKIWTVPGYAHDPFSAKFLMDFFRMDPVNEFEVCSFTSS